MEQEDSRYNAKHLAGDELRPNRKTEILPDRQKSSCTTYRDRIMLKSQYANTNLRIKASPLSKTNRHH